MSAQIPREQAQPQPESVIGTGGPIAQPETVKLPAQAEDVSSTLAARIAALHADMKTLRHLLCTTSADSASDATYVSSQLESMWKLCCAGGSDGSHWMPYPQQSRHGFASTFPCPGDLRGWPAALTLLLDPRPSEPAAVIAFASEAARRLTELEAPAAAVSVSESELQARCEDFRVARQAAAHLNLSRISSVPPVTTYDGASCESATPLLLDGHAAALHSWVPQAEPPLLLPSPSPSPSPLSSSALSLPYGHGHGAPQASTATAAPGSAPSQSGLLPLHPKLPSSAFRSAFGAVAQALALPKAAAAPEQSESLKQCEGEPPASWRRPTVERSHAPPSTATATSVARSDSESRASAAASASAGCRASESGLKLDLDEHHDDASESGLKLDLDDHHDDASGNSVLGTGSGSAPDEHSKVCIGSPADVATATPRTAAGSAGIVIASRWTVVKRICPEVTVWQTQWQPPASLECGCRDGSAVQRKAAGAAAIRVCSTSASPLMESDATQAGSRAGPETGAGPDFGAGLETALEAGAGAGAGTEAKAGSIAASTTAYGCPRPVPITVVEAHSDSDSQRELKRSSGGHGDGDAASDSDSDSDSEHRDRDGPASESGWHIMRAAAPVRGRKGRALAAAVAYLLHEARCAHKAGVLQPRYRAFAIAVCGSQLCVVVLNFAATGAALDLEFWSDVDLLLNLSTNHLRFPEISMRASAWVDYTCSTASTAALAVDTGTAGTASPTAVAPPSQPEPGLRAGSGSLAGSNAGADARHTYTGAQAAASSADAETGATLIGSLASACARSATPTGSLAGCDSDSDGKSVTGAKAAAGTAASAGDSTLGAQADAEKGALEHACASTGSSSAAATIPASAFQHASPPPGLVLLTRALRAQPCCPAAAARNDPAKGAATRATVTVWTDRVAANLPQYIASRIAVDSIVVGGCGSAGAVFRAVLRPDAAAATGRLPTALAVPEAPAAAIAGHAEPHHDDDHDSELPVLASSCTGAGTYGTDRTQSVSAIAAAAAVSGRADSSESTVVATDGAAAYDSSRVGAASAGLKVRQLEPQTPTALPVAAAAAAAAPLLAAAAAPPGEQVAIKLPCNMHGKERLADEVAMMEQLAGPPPPLPSAAGGDGGSTASGAYREWLFNVEETQAAVKQLHQALALFEPLQQRRLGAAAAADASAEPDSSLELSGHAAARAGLPLAVLQEASAAPEASLQAAASVAGGNPASKPQLRVTWPQHVPQLVAAGDGVLVTAPFGVPLKAKLAQLPDGKARLHYIKQLMPDLLRALIHCQARGIVHRSIRTDNIIVVPASEGDDQAAAATSAASGVAPRGRDRAVLIDYGNARCLFRSARPAARSFWHHYSAAAGVDGQVDACSKLSSSYWRSSFWDREPPERMMTDLGALARLCDHAEHGDLDCRSDGGRDYEDFDGIMARLTALAALGRDVGNTGSAARSDGCRGTTGSGSRDDSAAGRGAEESTGGDTLAGAAVTGSTCGSVVRAVAADGAAGAATTSTEPGNTLAVATAEADHAEPANVSACASASSASSGSSTLQVDGRGDDGRGAAALSVAASPASSLRMSHSRCAAVEGQGSLADAEAKAETETAVGRKRRREAEPEE